jgi:hypothetical protein
LKTDHKKEERQTMNYEVKISPSSEEQAAVMELLRRPQFAEAAKRLFPVQEPPRQEPVQKLAMEPVTQVSQVAGVTEIQEPERVREPHQSYADKLAAGRELQDQIVGKMERA